MFVVEAMMRQSVTGGIFTLDPLEALFDGGWQDGVVSELFAGNRREQGQLRSLAVGEFGEGLEVGC